MAQMNLKINIGSSADKLKKLSTSLSDIVQNDISSALDDGIDVAKGLARVKTGFMRDHITQFQTAKYKWNFVSAATYSSFQDLGTTAIEGTHFMEAGVKTAHAKSVLAIKEDINALV